MTWKVEQVQLRSALLDFTSSGQGHYQATQLLLDGELFSNAVELASWDAERTQALLCTACGFEHCSSGSWVMLRSAGALRLFVPVFTEWPNEQDRLEYGPPALLDERGAPLFEPATFAALRALVPGIPADAPRLTPSEALQLLAFEAPRSVVARGFARHQLGHGLLAADGLDLAGAIDGLIDLFERLRTTSGSLVACPCSAEDRRITVYANDVAMSAWTPMVRTARGNTALHWSGWAVDVATDAR